DEPYRAGDPMRRALVDLGGARTGLGMPLRKEETVVGVLNVFRQEIRPFSEKQIALLQKFAAQAVIALGKTPRLTQTRPSPGRPRDQQPATAEVLGVINSSPGALTPVFDAMLEKAMRLCDGAQGPLWLFDGDRQYAAAAAGVSTELANQLREPRDIHAYQQR